MSWKSFIYLKPNFNIETFSVSKKLISLSKKVRKIYLFLSTFCCSWKTSIFHDNNKDIHFSLVRSKQFIASLIKKERQLSAVSKKCQFNRPICSVRVDEFYLFPFFWLQPKKWKQLRFMVGRILKTFPGYHQRLREISLFSASSNYGCLLKKYLWNDLSQR